MTTTTYVFVKKQEKYQQFLVEKKGLNWSYGTCPLMEIGVSVQNQR